MTEVSLDDLKRKLQGVGKKCFLVSYWELSAHGDDEPRDELIRRIQQDNDIGSLGAARTKASCGLWIFRNGLQRQALKLIIDSSLPLGDRRRARDLIDLL